MSSDRSSKNIVRLRRQNQRDSAGPSTGDGLVYDTDSEELSILLAANPGLEFSSGALKVKLNGATLTLGASGLSVTNPLVAAEGIYSVTGTKTGAYNAVIGEMVLGDVSGGGFIVTLPTPVGVGGRSIVVKSTVASANTLTIDTAAGNIDGAASVTIATIVGSKMFVSDNANWTVL